MKFTSFDLIVNNIIPRNIKEEIYLLIIYLNCFNQRSKRNHQNLIKMASNILQKKDDSSESSSISENYSDDDGRRRKVYKNRSR